MRLYIHAKYVCNIILIHVHTFTYITNDNEKKRVFGLVVLHCFIFIGLRVFMYVLQGCAHDGWRWSALATTLKLPTTIILRRPLLDLGLTCPKIY